MKRIVFGFVTFASISIYAQQDITIDKVIFGTFVSYHRIVNVELKNSDNEVLKYNENSQSSSNTICIAGEANEFVDLTLNKKNRERIIDEVCGQPRELRLSNKCGNKSKRFLKISYGPESSFNFKRVPEILNIKLSNDQEEIIDCSNYQ
jgi:hypothetical protein